MAHVESKYLDFCVYPPAYGRKTVEVDVRSKSSDFRLGTIHWYGPWRQYTFSPNDGTTFNKACLREIASYCEQLTQEHRTAAKEQP